ncbi:MAG TPA: hypothetical protein VIY08_12210 [Candidatus Nitrosocosmicus sp.]
MNLKEKMLERINDGIFEVTFCTKCKEYSWPPRYNCKSCFKFNVLKEIENKGILLEKSFSHLSNNESFFGVGEFNKIRILGTINNEVEVNDLIFINSLKIIDKRISLEFKKL